MTGSVVLAIKALLMNLLTTAATAGILVLVFQDGNLTGPLGFTKPEGIEQTDFLVLVAIVFGLSTDYGVFLSPGSRRPTTAVWPTRTPSPSACNEPARS